MGQRFFARGEFTEGRRMLAAAMGYRGSRDKVFAVPANVDETVLASTSHHVEAGLRKGEHRRAGFKGTGDRAHAQIFEETEALATPNTSAHSACDQCCTGISHGGTDDTNQTQRSEVSSLRSTLSNVPLLQSCPRTEAEFSPTTEAEMLHPLACAEIGKPHSVFSVVSPIAVPTVALSAGKIPEFPGGARDDAMAVLREDAKSSAEANEVETLGSTLGGSGEVRILRGNGFPHTPPALANPPRPQQANHSPVVQLSVAEHFILLDDVLGSGELGVVRPCVEKRTGRVFACRTLDGSQLTDIGREDLWSEVLLMGSLPRHSNIVKLEAVYEEGNNVHVIMELCEGGDLFDFIAEHGRCTEAESAWIFRRATAAVNLCHHAGVAHFDVKLENLLISFGDSRGSFRSSLEIKLADFGKAAHMRRGQELRGSSGSLFYMAPEVVTGGEYDDSADVWSLGVILYVLLSGYFPFWAVTRGATLAAICDSTVDFTSDPWPSISKVAKTLVRSLLDRDRSARPSTDAILNHSWLQTYDTARSKPPRKFYRASGSFPGARNSKSKWRKLYRESVQKARMLPEGSLGDGFDFPSPLPSPADSNYGGGFCDNEGSGEGSSAEYHEIRGWSGSTLEGADGSDRSSLSCRCGLCGDRATCLEGAKNITPTGAGPLQTTGAEPPRSRKGGIVGRCVGGCGPAVEGSGRHDISIDGALPSCSDADKGPVQAERPSSTHQTVQCSPFLCPPQSIISP
eukprot:TRINITY_DN593_c0_g1_i1.p1 TRINITY_DN593_c0_g1~~TRINITY_DN593_c0_g1_i1.p1  ORF type:complete len:741 (+),score=56.69 TRINITY_DN593_c0_g1_i1:339-2561(+)